MKVVSSCKGLIFWGFDLNNILYVIQVGGLEKAYAAAKPLFLSMGKNTIYCGGAGTGSVCSC